jgi:hypothetical protein
MHGNIHQIPQLNTKDKEDHPILRQSLLLWLEMGAS